MHNIDTHSDFVASSAPASALVTESDDYSKTVRGIDIKVIRIAGESAPTEI
jgi:hypothetical protein